MQSEITYNFLVWEKFEELPFPEEVKKILPEELSFECSGLPENYGKYSVICGSDLYLDEKDGKVCVEKSDFSGPIIFAVYVKNPDRKSTDYLVSFDAEIKDGKVEKVELGYNQLVSGEQYDIYTENIRKNVNRQIYLNSLFLYKYFYYPYKVIFRYSCVGLIWLLQKAAIGIEKSCEFLTPI